MPAGCTQSVINVVPYPFLCMVFLSVGSHRKRGNRGLFIPSPDCTFAFDNPGSYVSCSFTNILKPTLAGNQIYDVTSVACKEQSYIVLLASGMANEYKSVMESENGLLFQICFCFK